MRLLAQHLATPVGEITLVTYEAELMALSFAGRDQELRTYLERRISGYELQPATHESLSAKKILAYFNGELHALGELEVSPRGTEFQQSVWTALRDIQPGTTASYGEVAGAIGNPGASRAVGLANRHNPIALVVPCHRVIGANGKLTGFAGGIERKAWLLEHERRHA